MQDKVYIVLEDKNVDKVFIDKGMADEYIKRMNLVFGGIFNYRVLEKEIKKELAGY